MARLIACLCLVAVACGSPTPTSPCPSCPTGQLCVFDGPANQDAKCAPTCSLDGGLGCDGGTTCQLGEPWDYCGGKTCIVPNPVPVCL
jgi:hypothetical protein